MRPPESRHLCSCHVWSISPPSRTFETGGSLEYEVAGGGGGGGGGGIPDGPALGPASAYMLVVYDRARPVRRRVWVVEDSDPVRERVRGGVGGGGVVSTSIRLFAFSTVALTSSARRAAT